MLKGKTKSGFSFEIDDKALDDMELLEDLVAVDNDLSKLPELLNKFLGVEQKKKLYDHVRTKKGNVPIKKVADLFMEILNTAGKETKN